MRRCNALSPECLERIHRHRGANKREREVMMQKIVEYRILYSSYIEDLQNQVNALIKMGWIPHGDLCFGGGIYHQTMVLTEKAGQ
jgi:hypothetical protein